MRTGAILGISIFVGWLAGAPALAQQGPLAAPDTSPTPQAEPASPPKHVAHKARRHTVRKAATGAEAASAPSMPATADAPHLATPRPAEDPISLGMKWNGSNDDARQTRIQNYDGNAAGTGAEVGLKLHF